MFQVKTHMYVSYLKDYRVHTISLITKQKIPEGAKYLIPGEENYVFFLIKLYSALA